MTQAAYIVPDAPTDPESAALELIVRLPSSLSDRLAVAAQNFGLVEILQDYCSVLDAERAFEGLPWDDAKAIAVAICFDICNPRRRGRLHPQSGSQCTRGHRQHGVAEPRAGGAGAEHRGDGARAAVSVVLRRLDCSVNDELSRLEGERLRPASNWARLGLRTLRRRRCCVGVRTGRCSRCETGDGAGSGEQGRGNLPTKRSLVAGGHRVSDRSGRTVSGCRF